MTSTTQTASQDKNNSDIRDVYVSFRVREDERSELRDIAQQKGTTVGSYLRKISLGVPVTRKDKRPTISSQQTAQFLDGLGRYATKLEQVDVSINRIGNNINQMARAFNKGDSPSTDAVLSGLYEAVKLIEETHQLKKETNQYLKKIYEEVRGVK